MWIDKTTYRRLERKGTPPRVWQLKNKHITILVVWDHIHYPNEWVLRCNMLGIDVQPLGLKDQSLFVQAQNKALSIVKEKLESIIKSIS